MRDIRVLNMSAGQKIEDEDVMKRIGELSYRNVGSLAKMFLIDTSNTKAMVIGDGLRVEPYSGMIIKVTAGDCFQTITSGTSGGNAVPCIQTTDLTVEVDAADGTIRTDLIEAQVISVADKDDTVQIATLVTGTSGSVGSSVIVTNETVQRDIKYKLQVQSQKNTTIPTNGTTGELIGTVDLTGVVDLSSQYLLNIADGEDGSYQEIDCRGADPVNTTRAEIIAAINSTLGRTMASAYSSYIKLVGSGLGEASIFKIKPPVTDADKDALQTIMGVSIGGSYKYTYQGTNAWFKLAEIDIGTTTTTITSDLIRNIDKKDSWSNENTTIKLMNNRVYDGIEKADIGKIANCDDSSIGWDTWKDFKKMIQYSIDAGTVFSTNILSTYALVNTVSGAYRGGVLSPNGDIHMIPYFAGAGTVLGQKISASGVVSTYALVYTIYGAYSGGVLSPNGDIHMIPYNATVGQKINSSGVVSTYALVYTTSILSRGGVLSPDGSIHMIPYNATVGQKISASGVVSTYALVYTASGAYRGGVLSPDGSIHMIPCNATVGQKISASGVVSTYALVYTTAESYSGGVLSLDGDIHMIPYNATVGQKTSASGVVSTYALVYTTSAGASYRGGVLSPDGSIHMIPGNATVGQKISASGVVSTYALAYTTTANLCDGGILAPDGSIHFIPFTSNVGQKINSLSAVPFNKAMCLSSFLNKI